uniref:S1 motif domain-containing protein n=1 Tax=Helicotheca tamesis TaxID=374047 RepID=A0A7S2H459_9STRA|mmetsp:Transcript_15123/g.20594  ORF Transcript_15123/g.20594 Transcript_15123/m.20594 type:complete len:419 (+) Transcript_15123:122-1378(+)|eukprot:CAMPEP_0185735902 /NCGR_PEP_ID=MMETSP1171-20130828/26393_1 /TAXON_ID=374046 /ORGANISM="Helicotheca tamensis, Strain CCMP826" /LENGTH=418 /DNA_ID=CAMNT_0028406349 /DNA_START=112 /DNA_END=1368 /DNA_ORIENTATION=-
MRLSGALAVVTAAAASGVATAFTSAGPAFVPASKCALNSAVADTVAEDAPSKPKQQQLTRFDRLKKSYKGPKIDLSDEGLDFSYGEFDEAVEATDYAFNRNDVVKGTVVQYDNGGCIVDIGAKASAFLPINEAALVLEQGAQIESVIDIDQERDFQIISEEDENGQLLVSVRRIQYREAWDKVVAMNADDGVFEATCVGVNRGGAICLVEGLRAFLPGSHLTGQLPTEDLIGQTLPLKFLEVNQEANKLVVSNRRAVVEEQMADLSRGDIINGIVKALKPYGAFVEVGGMSGLLHISQISYDRIDDLEKVLQPGDQVKCMIIDHDKVNGRIALSTKTLEPEPGDMLRDPARVYDMAEETAARYHERMEAERKAREEAAKDIVLGLGDSLDDLTGDGDGEGGDSDPLADVSDNLDSLLS